MTTSFHAHPPLAFIFTFHSLLQSPPSPLLPSSRSSPTLHQFTLLSSNKHKEICSVSLLLFLHLASYLYSSSWLPDTSLPSSSSAKHKCLFPSSSFSFYISSPANCSSFRPPSLFLFLPPSHCVICCRHACLVLQPIYWFDYLTLHNKWIYPYIHVAFVRAHRDKYALISMDKWDYFLNITYMCLECRKKLQKYALLWWNKTFAPRTRLENVHVWPAEGSKGLKKKKLTTWRFTALPKCRT